MATAIQMNLSALQRQDRSITGISETSPQVTLYCFDVSRNQWSRTDIEGSLFLCERLAEPSCSIIILNKKDPRNHSESVSKSFEFQVQEKFLLYKAKNDGIYGLWFYDEKECVRISSSLTRIIKGMDSKMKTPSKRHGTTKTSSHVKSSAKPVPQRGQPNLLAMLSQAQQRFEEDRKRQHSPNQSSPPQDEGSQFSFSTNTAPVIQISNGNGKAIKILQKPKQSSENGKNDSVVPSAVTAVVGCSDSSFSPPSLRVCPSQQSSTTKPDRPANSRSPSIEDPPLSLMESPFTPIKPVLSPSSSSNNLSLTFASNLLTPELLTMSLAEQDNLLNSQAPSASDSLLSPEAILGCHSPTSSNSLPGSNGVPGFQTSDVLLSESSGAISPTVGSGNRSSGSPINPLLSREQLRDALITLIETDDDLVSKLHEAYVSKLMVCDM